VDLDGFFRWATDFVGTAGRAARAGGKRQPARCSRKTQDKVAPASMAKKLLRRFGTSAFAFFAESMHACRQVSQCEHHACAGVYVREVL